MKLEYRSAEDNELLDTITVDGSRVTYETGRARDIFESRVQMFGLRKALRQLKNWSNGYVRMREVPNQ